MVLSGNQQKNIRTEQDTANLRTKFLEFRGFDSSRILNVRGGLFMSMDNFRKKLSQEVLVGIILVGQVGVHYEALRAEQYRIGRDETDQFRSITLSDEDIGDIMPEN